jgi:alkyl hydroperoxide reductase subunit AhpF
MSIKEPERDVPLFGAFEAVVLGGGASGIAAAAAAG